MSVRVIRAGPPAYADLLGLLSEGKPSLAGETFWQVPGATFAAISTMALTASTLFYSPCWLWAPMTADRLGLEVTVIGAGATTARMGIYEADEDWQPGALVVDGGAVAVDSLGVKSVVIDETLPVGRYLLAVNSDGTPTLRRYLTPARGVRAAMGSPGLAGRYSVASAYGALPDPGPDWDTIVNASSGFDYPVLMRFSGA